MFYFQTFLSSGSSGPTEGAGDSGDCPGPRPPHRGPVPPPAGGIACPVGQVLHRRDLLQTGPGHLRGPLRVGPLPGGQGARRPGCAVPEARQVSSHWNMF